MKAIARVAFLWFLLVFGASLPTAGAADASSAAAMPTAPAAQDDAGTGPPIRVHVGLYLLAVPELDLKTNSYLADFYVWFRWPAGSGLDPSKTFEFTNSVQSWDLMRRPLYTREDGTPAPEIMPDGSLYQIFHIHGRFMAPFDLRDYPFDKQSVRIEVEESTSLTDRFTYVWDRDGSLYHDDLVIPGWTLRGAAADVDVSTYKTNFGNLRNTGGQEMYPRFNYTLTLERPLAGYLVKTVLPITVVMLITFVVFFIHLRYFEGRIGLAITGLVSAVALQLTSAGELPNVGYMVLLDKIYNLSYVVIFVALAESVIAVRLFDAGREAVARRLDRIGFALCGTIFFGGSLLITFLR